MKNNPFFLFTIIVLLIDSIGLQAYQFADESGNWQQSLNGTWKFKLNGPADHFFETDFSDGDWESIEVPSNWEMEGFEEPVYQEPTESTGLYRTLFAIPQQWKDRHVFIRFEGVLYGFEFWINGERVGQFESAFNRSEFDISSCLNRNGENILAVKVYKRFKGYEFDTHDAWALSGIYRDVILLAVPEVHIEDLTLVTKLSNDRSAGQLISDLVISGFGNQRKDLKYQLSGELVDKTGRIVSQFNRDCYPNVRGTAAIKIIALVDNPLLWNAETPNLYALNISLMKSGNVMEKISRKVGFRQVSIDRDVLKLNEASIKLRGVDRHEIHPDVGRALREEHWRQDIELMKAANINTIRTSHYPPHPRLLELCDEYGIYVICEVPFGYGDGHLSDESYQNILYRRADATVNRDKNHPSIIIWSIGNENPFTQLVENTARRVKEMDPTRPILIPMAEKGRLDLPAFIDILAPHYPYAYPVKGQGTRHDLTMLATSKDIIRPVIATEYSHSLGLAFEGLGRRWEVMQKYDRLAGGCIWLWADQGILRKVNGRRVYDSYADPYAVPKRSGLLSGDVWLDNNTLLDSHGSWGTDGIVYADRRPQVDYWVTRKVYSPVVIREKDLAVQSGNHQLTLTIENRYDFTDLNKIKGSWTLLSDGKQTDSGSLQLSLAPHHTSPMILNLDCPPEMEKKENSLQLSFTDFNGRTVYEHAVHLRVHNRDMDLPESLLKMSPARLEIKKDSEFTVIGNRYFSLKLNHVSGTVDISGNIRGDAVVLHGPVLRVGRRPTMAERINYPKTHRIFWEKYLLDKPVLIQSDIISKNRNVIVSAEYKFSRQDSGFTGEKILANLRLNISPRGWIDVDYILKPVEAGDYLLEFGLGFLLPKEMSEFYWLGDGPYDAYPGKDEASERGIYHLSSSNLYYPGNRKNVDVAVTCNEKGSGTGFISDSSNVSCEIMNDGIVFTQNLLVAGKGNKPGGKITMYRLPVEKINEVKGHLTLVPLVGKNRPKPFDDLFNLHVKN